VDINNDGSLLLQTNRGPLELDFLFFSTGFKIDWSLRAEFKDIAPHILNWSDRYTPPRWRDQELADSPYLRPVFEFQQKTPGSLPGLERIHCFCYPAAASPGARVRRHPGHQRRAYRLAQGIAALMYSEDVEDHYRNIQAYEEPELEGDEWTDSP
jgi:cation diffusion facilitator CzcD-associated flavoprotein CzcO